MTNIFNKSESELFFEFLIIKGLKRIGKYDNPRYVARCKHEFDRMLEKGYINYFLCTQDFVNKVKKDGIMVGPGRGSCGGSLIAYCLNITEVDPIEHELLFSRFLGPSRRDNPDADLDFQDDRRQEVFEYLKQRYGEKHCAQIITYARFHPKGILRDMGRIFDIPGPEINKICSMVLERSGGDARASFSLQDTFEEFSEAKSFKEKYPLASEIAMKLEGNIRHKGVHAAAMVVAEEDVATYLPITRVNDEIVTEWEKQMVEDAKLVKYDILGLKTLSILQDAAKSAGVELPKKFEDSEVYKKVFKPAQTVGVFQLGTVGMQKFSSQLEISCFSDLYDATTLFRPSCLHSGQAMVYVNRKKGIEPIIHFHPSLEQITNRTKGVILYQEQIQHIMIKVAGLSVATAEFARKVITKSKGKDAFNKMRAEFVAGAKRKSNIEKDEAEKLFDIVSTFGSYGFNLAHAVEYSIISYWGAWLKTYYPQHFFKALLKYETDEKEIKNYTQDMKRLGISVEFPDINHSELSYSIIGNRIYPGLSCVIGLGESAFNKIKEGRPYISLSDFKKRCKIAENIFKGLVVADAFREFKINKRAAFQGEVEEKEKQMKLFGSNKPTEEFSEIELAQMIFEYTNLTPKIDVKSAYNFGDYEFTDISDLPNHEGGKQYILRGIVTDVLNKDKLLRQEKVKHTHHFDHHLIYLNLNDGTGNIAIQLSPETCEKYNLQLENFKKQPIIVFGASSKDGKKLYGDVIQIISKEHRTYDIDEIYKKAKLCRDDEAILTAAHPAVSKNGKSYYKVMLHNGKSGLCFRFTEKLFPGLMVKYSINQDPFINLEVITREEAN